MWNSTAHLLTFLLACSRGLTFTPSSPIRTYSALWQPSSKAIVRSPLPFQSGGGKCPWAALPETCLLGWFDGWGTGSSGPRTGSGTASDGDGGQAKGGAGGGRGKAKPPHGTVQRAGPIKQGSGKGKGKGKAGLAKAWGGDATMGLLDGLRESLSSLSSTMPVIPGEDLNVRLPWDGANFTLKWKDTALFAGGLVCGLVVATGVLVGPPSLDGRSGMEKSLTLFENVLIDIDQGYVEAVDMERLMQTAVVSMLRTLDPYTEFQNFQAAADLKESVSGRYGGVGLVIAGGKSSAGQLREAGGSSSSSKPEGKTKKGVGGPSAEPVRPVGRDGITVVSAFEGYAFDAGMRAGDRITGINGQSVDGITVDKARDMLRGEPNSKVSISFIRDGKAGQIEQEINLTRRLVKLRDVKLATLVGNPKAPVGYLQLAGFSKGAGQELAMAYRYLDSMAKGGLTGLVLDLRGNPGGLLESAVDVSALLVPEGSNIVSVRGRNFQDVTYRSAQSPLRPSAVPLVVLTNGGTASAAEIVSGAVQDLDAGVIMGVGKGRTYGKGLVQNVAELPYNNALKYTVAKYYTPSGRCIQSVNYKEGGVQMGDASAATDGGLGYSFEAEEVPELERKEFVTKHGRVVFDGGGVEADVKVKLPKPSALEIALQVQGAYFDYAGHWTRTHDFTGTRVVTDKVLNDFRQFVLKREKEGSYHLASIYQPQLESLEAVLGESNLKDGEELLGPFSRSLTREMLNAFWGRREEIRESLEEAIMSRYLPESMVLKRSLDHDQHFLAALDLVQDKEMYRKIITPADAQLTEDVLRSFGQAVKKSVDRHATT